ncbi:hypothetical protein OAA38_00815 [bacterium]|nr:hypothetical protein [bacterium]
MTNRIITKSSPILIKKITSALPTSQSIITAGIDSADVIILIDSAHVRPLARAALVAGSNITYDSATGTISSTASGTVDSAAINTLIAAADTHDSAAVLGQINTKFANNATFSKDLNVDSNLTVGGYIGGPAVFTIDPAAIGDSTGKVIILGNLQVDGTQTTINSTTVSISDKNIVLADSATSASQADGAGITINGASATLQYASTGDKWVFNKAPYYNANRILTTADDLHDSAAVVGQIDSAATSYTLDFVTTNGNTTTNNIEVGTINNIQVDRGAANNTTSLALGTDALVNETSGVRYNIAIGSSALKFSTIGTRNVGVGYNALRGAANTADSASYNVAIGFTAMASSSLTGSYNTAIGPEALRLNTSGVQNVAIGNQASEKNTTGGSNTAIGGNTLLNNITGSSNIAIGRSALQGAGQGAYSNNTAIGYYALSGLKPDQSNNIAIGSGAGQDLDSGSDNIIIGSAAEASSTLVNDEITLGNTGDRSLRIPGSLFYINGGSEGTPGSKVGIGTSSPTAQLDVVGEVFVSTLTPSTDSALATKKYVDDNAGGGGTDSATVVSIVDSAIGVSSIGALSNVDLSGISTNNILKWDGAKFVAAVDATSGGGSGIALSDLSATDAGGFGSFAYNNVSGVFTYTGADSAAIKTVTSIPYSNLTGTPTIPTVDSAAIRPFARAAITAGSNITYDSATGVIAAVIGDTHDSAAVQGQIDSASASFLSSVSDDTMSANLAVTGTITTGTGSNTTVVDATDTNQYSIKHTLVGTSVTTGNATQISTFAHSSAAAAVEYVMQLQEATTNKTQVTKVLATYDGSEVAFTEYGVVHTGDSDLGTFAVSIDGSNINLNFTRRGTNTVTVKIAKTIIV